MNFIGTVRSTFAAPDMPFVIGRILPFYGTAGDNALVCAAQETIQNEPGMANVSWINTNDLELAYGGHYGTQGQIDLGVRFANAFVQTPEPSTLVLLTTSLMALLAYAWRKRR